MNPNERRENERNEKSSESNEGVTTDAPLTPDGTGPPAEEQSHQTGEYGDPSDIFHIVASPERRESAGLSLPTNEPEYLDREEIERIVDEQQRGNEQPVRKYEEAVWERADTAPEVAWDYEEVDNQIRYEYPLKICISEGIDLPEDPDTCHAEAVKRAYKNPRWTAAMAHNSVAEWGFSDRRSIFGDRRYIAIALRGIDAARRELLALDYELLDGPSTKEEFLTREAKKAVTKARYQLSGWELQTVLDLLTTQEGISSTISIDDIIESNKILDRKDGVVRETHIQLEQQFLIFLFSAIASLGLLSLLYVLGPYIAPLDGWIRGTFVRPASGIWDMFGPLSQTYGPVIYVAVVLFGILGASISGLFSLRSLSPEVSEPLPTLGQDWLAVARVTIGASAALVLFLFFESGALSSLFALPLNDPLAAFMIAFVAGFSERLLVRSLESSFGESGMVDSEYPQWQLNRESVPESTENDED
ncbi:hypothetical protein [Natrinema caseinilyticum]|uniref:hypothetical protein n=1 Tax=Natrinema caseinilyticum TaxID=2961570 RepID=UPI0020C58ECB|nr:hypothetical protein [Natrinema caseinilyticum]